MQDVFHLSSGTPMLPARLPSHPDRIPGDIRVPYRMDFQKPVAPDDRHNAWKEGGVDVRGSPFFQFIVLMFRVQRSAFRVPCSVFRVPCCVFGVLRSVIRVSIRKFDIQFE